LPYEKTDFTKEGTTETLGKLAYNQANSGPFWRYLKKKICEHKTPIAGALQGFKTTKKNNRMSPKMRKHQVLRT
jgi:hypothetical protein